MASVSKYVRNQQRQKLVKEKEHLLKDSKKKLANACKRSQYIKIIENINNKLKATNLSADQIKNLKHELNIYEKKVNEIPELSYSEIWNLQFEMNKIGKELCRTRVRNRCSIPTCARPRGILTRFGLCRNHVREFACKGELPGNIYKVSW